MTLRKPDKTLADYAAIAISPVLIMVLVGSFVFYLLAISYAGEFTGRLRWTLFWFVLASVLISRISIEQGSEYAVVYGLGLALATAGLMNQLMGWVFAPMLLLALIWWCASKLTWDCTLIDEDEDASGEGLLEVAGLGAQANSGTVENMAPSGGEPPKAGPRKRALPRGPSPVHWWRHLFQHRTERAGRPHAPGIWVIYFSLAALPIFGMGQLLIPSGDASGRQYGFVLLWTFVAAALGLLLSTSLLGLRRYLRQRYLQMPGSMAGAWMGWGGCVALAVLLGCVLLPRPDANYSLTALADKIGSPPRSASKHALLRGEPGEGEGRRLENKEPGGPNLGEAPGPGERGNQQKDGGGAREKSGQPEGRAQDQPANRPKLEIPAAAESLANLLKWALYVFFAVIILRYVIRHGSQLLAALKEVLRGFFRFLRSLFVWGGEEAKRKRTLAKGGKETPRPRPFASFKNPFLTGAARRQSLAELVVFSFEALQAWARERSLERRPEQTPLEFSGSVHLSCPEISEEVEAIARYFSRIAYANQAPPPECLALLERLWRKMSSRDEGIATS